MINQLKMFGKKTLRLLLAFSVWLVMIILIQKAIIFFKTEHYQATDTPNHQFQIVVFKPINQPQAIYLKDFQNQVLVTPAQAIDWYGEDFLRKESDVLTYHNEGALWNTESKYKIVNQQVEPISFRLFTFVEALEAFVLSLVFYYLLKYLLKKIIQNRIFPKTANNPD